MEKTNRRGRGQRKTGGGNGSNKMSKGRKKECKEGRLEREEASLKK